MGIQEDQARELGLQRLRLKYYRERALKCLMNPSTTILGMSHTIVHVISRLTDTLTDMLTDSKSMTNYRLLQ